MKLSIILLAFLLFSPDLIAGINDPCDSEINFSENKFEIARQGCCSWHGGVCGCNFSRIVCCDGTYSPSCTCQRSSGGEIELLSSGNENQIAQGYHYVRPYTRSDGAYVPGHYRTNPDSSTMNNWSTKGNVNPFTGKPGYQNPTSIYNTYPNRGLDTYRTNTTYDYNYGY